MDGRLASIRIDRLNVPAENLRRHSSHTEMRKLQLSIAQHGVIVPLVVRPLGGGEYAVIDGSRRLDALRALGRAGSTEVPVIVVATDDAGALVAQVQINQVRERLSKLAEAEGLRALVADQGWEGAKAARALGKSRQWASSVMQAWSLPTAVVRDIRAGRLSFSHAQVLATHADRSRVFAFLYRQARTGQVSRRQLSVLGKRLVREGAAVVRLRPRRHGLGGDSWVRIEPLLDGVRAEVHLRTDDDLLDAMKRLSALLREVVRPRAVRPRG